ncbi:ATP-dependent protease ClpP protease subunit [Acetoanaerobium pronyense]|uniref:ATP-dependent Clp protease proteolytic subunit n=1 Tax=Acetoanaerobium pronyense TaxID=1482736 RepID=A0ABS4KI47_9FIRM|nr:head maturation protease, ClpP-related [Acetoanaerobium pronyense]MBP2027442.1 ATP-dependent protease ClpP protease subunit [Acetoanaerobium pronyense]
MKHLKTQFKVFRNESNNDITEMYLHGRIGDPVFDGDSETITVKDVREKLNNIDTKAIRVHINSGGGCLFSSIAISNLLKSHSARIEMIIDSLAGSGGSIIAMAGDEIKMYSNSMLMIHSASTFTFGNAKDHEKMSNDLKQMDKSLKENYKERFKGTDEELINLIESETWLTAEEAKDLGFCDQIITSNSCTDEIDNSYDVATMNSSESKVVAKLMQKYSNSSGANNILNNFSKSCNKNKKLFTR